MRIRRRTTARIYQLLSSITERFPGGGAAVVDRAIFATYGNPLLHRAIHRSAARGLGDAYRSICVVGDLHIGDAILSMAAVAGLRDLFPDARIDYVANPVAAPLLAGDPDVSEVLPAFTGRPFPDERDVAAVNAVLARGGYDLVVDLCPFLKPDRLTIRPGTAVVGYLGLAACVVEAQRDPRAVSHLTVQSRRFVHRLFAGRKAPVRREAFRGARVTLAAEAAERAARFLRDAGLDEGAPKVFVNPDTSSDFTRVPEPMLLRLLEGLTDGSAEVLLEHGRLCEGLERRLVAALPPAKRGRVTLVPATLDLDVYAALMDACDVFVTGDGGPLHVAAARKRGAGDTWTPRNRTAVLSVFGATPSRVYGYDAQRPGYLPANQDAPSRAWDAESTCRTFACINKGAIACRDARCFFGGLDVDAIVEAARAWCGAPAAEGPAALGAGAAPPA